MATKRLTDLWLTGSYASASTHTVEFAALWVPDGFENTPLRHEHSGTRTANDTDTYQTVLDDCKTQALDELTESSTFTVIDDT